MLEADLLIGHNIIGYDIPVIRKLTCFNLHSRPVYDTIVATRMGFLDHEKRGVSLIKAGKLPPKLLKSHSLKAWGYRLGHYKGTFGEDSDWQTYTPDMLTYCKQDVAVSESLYKHCLNKGEIVQEALDLEQEVARIITQQEIHGFKFDERKAQEFYMDLREEADKLSQQLQEVFPPFVDREWFTPKVNNKTRGYVKGVPFEKVKEIPFNPNSRPHIIRAFTEKYDWKPTKFTKRSLEQVEMGLISQPTPEVDEAVLSSLKYPEAKLLAKRLKLSKIMGMVGEGDQAWLKKVSSDGRLHGSVNSQGTRTRRMTHRTPNVAQVPACGKEYGKECRELFTVPEGYVLVGADASGLELRMLAHYMGFYDNGAYADVVLNGDVHTHNQKASGCKTRNQAKTFIYAFLYGCGDNTLSEKLETNLNGAKKVRAQFMKGLPALDNLINTVKSRTRNFKFLKSLDGQPIPSPSQHASLNTLLQSAGAVVMKRALVIAEKNITEQEIPAHFVANVHDEFQVECLKGYEEACGEILVDSIRKAGEYYNLRIPLDGEYKIGNNWSETH